MRKLYILLLAGCMIMPVSGNNDGIKSIFKKKVKKEAVVEKPAPKRCEILCRQ